MAEEITWKDEPEDEDYESALGYLSLLATATAAGAAVDRLRDAEITHHKPEDIWRASGGLSFGQSISAVSGELSPVLLVIAGDMSVPLIVASGYRSVYSALSSDTIPCKITHLP